MRKPVVLQNDVKHLSPTQRNVRGQFESNGVEGELKGADAGDSYQFNFTFSERTGLKGLSIFMLTTAIKKLNSWYGQ